MAFGTKGSVRELWHYIYKAVTKNPDIEFDELYNDPITKNQMKNLLHIYGPEKAEERFYQIFADIKRSHGYEEDECEEDEYEMEDDGQTLVDEVNEAVLNDLNTKRLIRSICRKNINNSRYNRMNIADNQSFRFN